MLDRVTEYDDDELAHKVNSIVEEARDLNGTVKHQREELEDLSERIESQAETIGELQTELDEYEAALNERDEQIAAYEEEIEDLKSRLKRKQADFQNYKKRAKKRQQQIKDRAAEDLVERLIGVRDNLKRALEEEKRRRRNAPGRRRYDASRVRSHPRGRERFGDRSRPGYRADPQRHEVMMQVDSDQPEGPSPTSTRPATRWGEGHPERPGDRLER